jgi:hypothetical protein
VICEKAAFQVADERRSGSHHPRRAFVNFFARFHVVS